MSSSQSQRAISMMLVLLLHGLLLFAFLEFMVQPHPRLQGAAERMLEMIIVIPRARAPVTIDARKALRQPAVTVPQETVPSTPAPLATAPSSGLAGLGRSLFGCAPEAYGSLPAEEQAHCPKPGGDLVNHPSPDLMGRPSHVKNEALWEAELARKKSPAWLPCTGSAKTPFGSAPSFDLVCIGLKAMSGELTDPREWPVYETKKYPAETLYKVQQTYDAWHKDHAGAPKDEARSVSSKK